MELENKLRMAAKIIRAALSNPTPECKYRRINITRAGECYTAEKLTETQAFHEILNLDELAGFIRRELEGAFRQLNAWTEDGAEHSIKITKKGKVLYNKSAAASAAALQTAHDRQKSYIIPEGSTVPPLVDMGIFTSDNKVVPSMYDKFRQINRFIEIIDDYKGFSLSDTVKAIDFGCGKSYLTFLLYHYFTEVKGKKAQILGLDLKDDVIASCNAAAKKYNYTGLTFKQGDIARYLGDFTPDILISLHACDTATDYALYHGIRAGVPAIFCAPCCQHELNGQIKPESLRLFSRYGLLQERAAAVLTDAIRANLLTSVGYKTQILEFVGFEHTPKNLMIRASKTAVPIHKKREAFAEVMSAVKEFNLRPTLMYLLINDNLLLDIYDGELYNKKIE